MQQIICNKYEINVNYYLTNAIYRVPYGGEGKPTPEPKRNLENKEQQMKLTSQIKTNAFTANTDGKGLWTKTVDTTTIQKVNVVCYVTDGSFQNEADVESIGLEVEVTGWKQGQGLIYGDDLWLSEFKAEMERQGYDMSGVDYTEQGLQGDVNHLSCMVSLETHNPNSAASLMGVV